MIILLITENCKLNFLPNAFLPSGHNLSMKDLNLFFMNFHFQYDWIQYTFCKLNLIHKFSNIESKSNIYINTYGAHA